MVHLEIKSIDNIIKEFTRLVLSLTFREYNIKKKEFYEFYKTNSINNFIQYTILSAILISWRIF